MISFLIKSLWVMGFDNEDYRVVVKTTNEDDKVIIWVDTNKKGKWYRKEFILEDIIEEEIECIYQQIVCEMFITKEIKD